MSKYLNGYTNIFNVINISFFPYHCTVFATHIPVNSPLLFKYYRNFDLLVHILRKVNV